MEQNLPVITKKIRSIVRVVFFMLRKGITKSQFIIDLNMMIKRSKIAGKAMIGNLIFHHHGSTSRRHASFTAPHEYEFSCSNSPAFPFHLTKRGRRRQHGSSSSSNNAFFECVHAPPTVTPNNDFDIVTLSAVKNVLERLNNVEASPMLPGFGRLSPMVRQLRVTDSPFPMHELEECDVQVDKDADEFIKKFYMQLKQQ